MTDAGRSTALARELRDKVADGDLTWVRQHFQRGELNFLKDRLTKDERAQFAGRIDDGDMPWIRDVLSRVEMPGVGVLSPLQTGAGMAAPSAVAAEIRPPMPPLPTTPLPPPPSAILPTIPTAATTLEAPSKAPTMPPAPWVDRRAAPAVAVPAAPASATVAASTDAVVTKVRKKRSLGPIFLLVAALLALLWWVNGRSKDDKVAAPTTVAAKPASSAAGSTVAGGPTSAAATASTAAGTAPGALSVPQTIAADKNLSVLDRAIGAAGLRDTLSNGGPYTMFAPTNEAFAQLPAGALDKLLANKDALTKVLLYHTAQGNLSGAGAKSGAVPSLTGQPLALTVEGTNVMVNGVAATPGTGTVYTIGKVLLPPGFSLDSLAAAPSVTTAAPAPATTAKPAVTTAAPAAATTAPPAATAAPSTTAAPAAPAAPATPAGGVSVYFNAGSSDLTEEAKSQLKEYAAKIKAAGGKPAVKVVGYADERGTPANIALVAGERAQRAINYLSGTLGVNATFTATNGGAIAGKDYDKARRVDISLG